MHSEGNTSSTYDYKVRFGTRIFTDKNGFVIIGSVLIYLARIHPCPAQSSLWPSDKIILKITTIIIS